MWSKVKFKGKAPQFSHVSSQNQTFTRLRDRVISKNPFCEVSNVCTCGFGQICVLWGNTGSSRCWLDVTTSERSACSVIMAAKWEVSVAAVASVPIRGGEFISLKEEQRTALKDSLDGKDVFTLMFLMLLYYNWSDWLNQASRTDLPPVLQSGTQYGGGFLARFGSQPSRCWIPSNKTQHETLSCKRYFLTCDLCCSSFNLSCYLTSSFLVLAHSDDVLHFMWVTSCVRTRVNDGAGPCSRAIKLSMDPWGMWNKYPSVCPHHRPPAQQAACQSTSHPRLSACGCVCVCVCVCVCTSTYICMCAMKM